MRSDSIKPKSTWTGAVRERQLRKYAERRAWYNNFMVGQLCADCGETDRAQLQWHHRDSVTKRHPVTRMVNIYPIRETLAEIEKCDLLCANCHVMRHTDVPTGDAFGDRVIAGRVRLKLTQEDLSDRVGITSQYLCAIERGRCLSAGKPIVVAITLLLEMEVGPLPRGMVDLTKI